MAEAKASLKTPKFRVAFANVFKPRLNDLNGKEEFSVAMLFEPGTDLSALKKAAADAVKEKWGDKIPANLRSPFRDQGEKEYDGFVKGGIFITAKSTLRPAVVGTEVIDGKLMALDETEFYSGCYAWASVRAYAYEQKGNKGVAFGLSNIQKLSDGDPLSGRLRPEDDFMPAGGSAASAPAATTSADAIFG